MRFGRNPTAFLSWRQRGREIFFSMVAIQNCLGRSFESRKMLLRNSFSFDGRELEAMFSIRSPSLDDDCDQLMNQRTNESDSYSPKLGNERRYEAALKLQKVYKSFRTRRQLADCAVLVEQKWWKVLDFAELKRSSVSFFDIEKPESAVSRWSRARTRAAKVGKGLSKDEKARKLALQHWLEAIDPRHRYGHNLQYYYVGWLHCDSRQPFFYWLDIGEGRGANLDICPRSKLQVQCIKYLGPKEREAYEVVVENGKFTYKQTEKVLDTTEAPKGSKWIFVLSTAKSLYVGLKHKGTFQHSSFLAGGATLSAGRLVVEDGILKAVWPHSGHYLPTEENFQAFMSYLMENNVDLTHVKKYSSEEEEGIISKKESNSVDAKSQSLAGLGTNFGEGEEMEDSGEQDTHAVEDNNLDVSRLSRALRSKIKKLEIPSREDVLEAFKAEQPPDACGSPTDDVSSEDGYETADDSLLSEDDFTFPKLCLFEEEEDGEFQTPIPEEAILQRINSHRRTKSYQLGAQLSCRWTTGAGPRIGCLRDYPSSLQAQALEQTNLSPRCDRSCGASPRIISPLSPRVVLPTGFRREITLRRSPLASEPVSPSPGQLINQT